MKRLKNFGRYFYNPETNEVISTASDKPVKQEGKDGKKFVRLTNDAGKRITIPVSKLTDYVGTTKKEDKPKKAPKSKEPKEPKEPEERVEILNGYTMAKSRLKEINEEINADKKADKIKEIAKDEEMSKNDRVRKLLAMGCPNPWIIVLIKVWPAYIHNVIKADEKRAEKAGK
jgi:hypothetical protein